MIVSRTAAADYSAKVGYIVYESDADQVTLCTDATAQKPLGVIHAASRDGLTVDIMVDGLACDVPLGENINIAATGRTPIASDANGKAKLADANDYILGWLDARVDVTTAANSTVRVFIHVSDNVLA